MKLKDLITAISQESGVPAGQVRKVTQAFTAKISELIEEQDGFRSGSLVFKPVTASAKTGENGEVVKPERKFARIVIRPRKPKGERKASRRADQNDD